MSQTPVSSVVSTNPKLDRYTWDHWRPVTAIHREGIWLDSGLDVYDPDWLPLLNTPSHQDYVSTHAAFGGAGAAVLKYINGGDEIDAWFSSNVTTDNQGVLTRHFTSIDYASFENARSRIFGGVSPPFQTLPRAMLTLVTRSIGRMLERRGLSWATPSRKRLWNYSTSTGTTFRVRYESAEIPALDAGGGRPTGADFDWPELRGLMTKPSAAPTIRSALSSHPRISSQIGIGNIQCFRYLP